MRRNRQGGREYERHNYICVRCQQKECKKLGSQAGPSDHWAVYRAFWRSPLCACRDGNRHLYHLRPGRIECCGVVHWDLPGDHSDGNDGADGVIYQGLCKAGNADLRILRWMADRSVHVASGWQAKRPVADGNTDWGHGSRLRHHRAGKSSGDHDRCGKRPQ